jgi:hypothetical protein
MKKLLAILALTLLTITAAAESPLPPWVSDLMGNSLPDGTQSKQGTFVAKTVRFIYDVATNGGSVAPHTLPVILPPNAVITRSYFKIVTAFTSGASGGGTVAISCEDANNIKTATDLSSQSANAFVEGESTGAASAFKRAIAAPCSITATVASTAQTAGKLVGWLDYVIEL